MTGLTSIFKAYDIRGRTDNGELTPEIAERIGAAFARFTVSKEIAVGRDCRLSSPGLANALIKGAVRQGVDVVDLGEVATDTVYYVSGRYDVPGAVVTASHNPSNYNGIKFCKKGAAPVGADSGLGEIRAMAETASTPAATPGTTRSLDAIPGYVDHLLAVIEPERIGPLRVAVDAGNGMGGVVVERVFNRIAPTLLGLYLEPDGTFPNHPADPLRPENLVDLTRLMEREGADLGVAFDGDADRAFFIDDRRIPLSGSTTTALIARWFLAREPGAAIVHNLITSRAVGEIVNAAGGRPIRTRVGHSYIKAVMAETGAVFGGEHSGHYYFRANYRADSGMLAMLVLLQVLSESGRKLSDLRREVEPYAASGEINFKVTDPREKIEVVAQAFAGADQDRLDGLTVSWPDRWFNLRPSNTEPYVRFNAEAADRQTVEGLVAAISRLLED